MTLVRQQIHTDIESQFPALYREYGELFVLFTEYYYEFVDGLENNFRQAFEIRDVDTTFERFLVYFREKYMKGLPPLEANDTRFILKHINDFYIRKGTEEGLRLFFRIFFDEEVEVSYPTYNILRISDSQYGSNFYLEMKPVYTIVDYPIRKGDNISGTISQAQGFVDQIIFKNFGGAIVPIVFLSNLYNRFVSDDTLVVTGDRVVDGEVIEVTQRTSKIIRGSISGAEVLRKNRTSGNAVGDEVLLVSASGGQSAKAIVTAVSDLVTGELDFTVEDSGFGYTLANTTLETSTQAFVVYGDELSNTPQPLAEVSANGALIYDISSNTVYEDTTNGSGTLIAYEHPLIYVKTESETAFVPIPSNSYTNITIEGVGDVPVNAISPFPDDTASFELGNLNNLETVSIITDILSDFANTTLDSTNYGMSGPTQETANTRIVDAFTAKELTIGSISEILVNDTGIGYSSPVRSYINQDDISKFDKLDIGIIFDSPTFIIGAGDVVTQTYSLEIISDGDVQTIDYTAKAKFLRRVGDVFYFRPISFYGFNEDLPVNIRGQNFTVSNIIFDNQSNVMGLNAVVNGEISSLTGQILSINVFDTGFRYQDGEEVDLVDPTTNEVLGSAILTVRGMGYGEGRWETSTSFLNDPTKVIRDNLYYQEYSYDISTIIDPEEFVDISKDTFHVAGTKQFTSTLINSQNGVGPSIDVAFEVYNISEEFMEAISDGSNTGYLATSNNNVEGDLLVAVISELDAESSSAITQDINN